ncbi:Nif3-like dinuclear metal center hexameric protein [Gordonia crocea]|uniref:GTP cyclohydrolase 1 type 2 homolog n=1 Tax=Gordonia crocea TaxID=589162 RepID=A0A7I9V019_9ACTN|nr:Nif3-like dinuclear metal center hexameric protein [Gordonia crocea]GED98532.1 GTP cyclohydrolase 1 type 2 [Gordonia crocea]
MTVTLERVVETLATAYPPRLAESWDSVGLVCGEPAETVERALVCVDVTPAVVERALAEGCQLVIAHHPLLLRGVDTVAATTPKGALIHALIRGGCALYTAHTNADSARPGVSDALAELVGLRETIALQPIPSRLDKWVVMAPVDAAEPVRTAMFAAGAGEIGDYRHCAWTVVGTGQFEPLPGAKPAIGEVGGLTEVREARVEMVAPRAARAAVLAALRAAHPYEEPAFDVLELAELPGDVGLGRVGELAAPTTLRDFVRFAADRLPKSAWGIRAAGDPDRRVVRVAVCGGAGDSLIGAAVAAGADVYLTGDLRHHLVDEALRAGGPAFVDAGHWATEFPWCAQAASLLAPLGVDAQVFTEPTDPFGLHG